MAAQDLFNLFGELGIHTNNAFNTINQVENRVRQLAQRFGTDLTGQIHLDDEASGILDDVGSEAEQTANRLEQLQGIVNNLRSQLNDEITADVVVNDPTVNSTIQDLNALQLAIARLQAQAQNQIDVEAGMSTDGIPPVPSSWNNPSPSSSSSTSYSNHQVNVSTNVGEAEEQVSDLQSQLSQLQSQLQELNVNENSTINFRGLQTNVGGLLNSLEQVEDELGNIQNQINNINDSDLDVDVNTGEAGTGQSQQSFNNLTSQMASLQGTMAMLAAATAANAAGTVGPGSYGRGYARNPGYDINRVFQQQMRMNQMMLRYAQMNNPVNAVGRARERMDIGASVMPHFDKAQTQLEIQALTGMMTSSIMQARRQLSQLGFGRTNTEVKALEGALHGIANIQMDNLKDQIKLTEKALKDMKKSANASELTEEIRKAEASLANYRSQLADASPIKNMARVNGMELAKVAGKDVLVKPWKNQLDRMGGMLTQFFNRDVAGAMNKAYSTIDGAAKKIVGSQTSAAEQKAKIMQLQTRYQMLGQTINTRVTPIVAALGTAFTVAGAKAEESWSKFQGQTLTSTKDMKEYKNLITDTSVAANASQEEVGNLFSILTNQMGYTKDNIQEAAEMGLMFAKTWGVDAAEAVGNVNGISEELGVSTEQAQNIMALALKKHQGDIEAATKDVYENEKAWKKASAAGKEGADAYSQMVEGIDSGAVNASMHAIRQAGAALLELWKQLEPTIVTIANKVRVLAENVTEWLRNNPEMAKFVVHAIAIGGAFTMLLGILAPVAGFLLMHRNLFQALGQSMSVAGRGAAVLNPAARMVFDTLKMGRNAILGLPRVIAGVVPALIGMLRGLPGTIASMLVGFVKMNPMLAAFSAIAWVAYKNWDRVGPLLKEVWEQIKRIGKAVMDAFAGPGGDGAESFGKMMEKLAGVAGDLLVKALELLIPLLEGIATLMENGGGKFIVAAAAIWMVGGAAGGIIPSLSGLTGIFGGLTGIVGRFSGVFGGLALIFGKIKGLVTKIPAAFALVGRGLSMLAPLLLNPWTWVVLAIAGIVFVVIKYWDEIAGAFKTAWNAVTGWFKEHAGDILLALTGPLGWLGAFIAKHWDSIKKGIIGAWNATVGWLKEHAGDILIALSGPMGWLIAAIVKNWDSIKKAITGAWNATVGWLKEHGGDILIALSGPIGWLVAYIVRNWDTIKSKTIAAWNATINWLKGAWDSVKGFAKSAFDAAVNAIKAAWDWVARTSRNIWNGLKTFFKDTWDWIKNTASRIFNGAKNAINGAWDAVKKKAHNIWNGLKTWLSDTWNSIRKTASRIFGDIKKKIIDIWTSIKTKVTNLVKSLKNAIINAWETIKNKLVGFAKTIREKVVGAFNAVKEGAKSAASSVKKGLSSAFSYVVDKAKSFVKNLKNTLSDIWSGLKDIAGKAWEWGENIIDGLIGGVGKAAKKVWGAMTDVADTIKDAITGALDIHSPSRVMRGYGIFIGEGLVNGIRNMISKVGKASNQMATAVQGPDPVEVDYDVSKTIRANVVTAMASGTTNPSSGANNPIGNVTNSNVSTTTNDNSTRGAVTIQQATFQMNVEKLENAEDVAKMRKVIQNVVSNDLFGMAVRKL